MINKDLVNDYSIKQKNLLSVIRLVDKIKNENVTSLNFCGKLLIRENNLLHGYEDYINIDIPKKMTEKLLMSFIEEIQKELDELEQKIKLELNGQPKNIS